MRRREVQGSRNQFWKLGFVYSPSRSRNCTQGRLSLDEFVFSAFSREKHSILEAFHAICTWKISHKVLNTNNKGCGSIVPWLLRECCWHVIDCSRKRKKSFTDNKQGEPYKFVIILPIFCQFTKTYVFRNYTQSDSNK